jgi:acetyl/propionyl-CoA carboxylase alpha subunit
MDSGYDSGSEVSVYYDPLLAKIICWGKDKNEALKKMSRALDETSVTGIITNKKFLSEIIRNEDFVIGNYNINFLENNFRIKHSAGENMDAAVVFAILMKKTGNIEVKNNITQNNKWTDLRYE